MKAAKPRLPQKVFQEFAMKKKPLQYNPDDGSANLTLEAILDCYRQLSPENLEGDAAHIRRTIAETEQKLRRLFTHFGREVSQDEILWWEQEKQTYKNDKRQQREGVARKHRPKMAATRKQSKRSTATKTIDKVRALIDQYQDKACTQEALNKFAEIVVAEHGMWDGPDEIVVMGYFDPIEGYVLSGEEKDEFTYDLSMESLGSALRKLGVRTISENNYALDETTGKFYCPPGKNCSNFFMGHVTPLQRQQRKNK
jgi:hypothetical protein